jgi:RNA polymerase sigma-70 factor (ECF subfamily)
LRVRNGEPILTTMSTAPTSDPEVRLTPSRIAEVLVASSRSFSSYLESEVGSRAVCNEILQDAFGRGTHSIGVLNAHESAIDWLYRLLRNAVLDQPRSEGSSEPKFSAFRAQIEPQLEPRVALKEALQRYVRELCAVLEPEYAAALRSVELGGATIEGFAEATGISTRLASIRLSNARAALRRCVVSSAGICAVHGRWNCTCGLAFIGYGQARPR